VLHDYLFIVYFITLNDSQMKEHGALGELYWQWKPENLEKTLSYCQFDHNKSHTDWPGNELGPSSGRPATNRLRHGTVLVLLWAKSIECNWFNKVYFLYIIQSFSMMHT